MINNVRAARGRASEIYREHGIRELFMRVFLRPSRNGFVQFIRYGIVGVISAAVDTGTLLLLAEVFKLNYVVAGTIGFVLGTIVNYAISVKWVFQPTGRTYTELLLFVLIGAAGLIVNDVVLWAGQSWLGWGLFWAKILAIVVGFMWNFLLRKALFDRLGASLAKRAATVAYRSAVDSLDK